MNIEFFCSDENIRKYWPPKVAGEFIPEDFLNLPNIKDSYRMQEDPISNIKGCIPLQDFLSSGYIITNAYELDLGVTFKNFREDLTIKTAKTISTGEQETKIYARKEMAVYYESACPVINESKKQRAYFKAKTAWGIKTPPGYSCLIIQPSYINEKRFSLMPAIVDTDTYHLPIPIAGYLNVKESIRITPGTPLVQIIPFKRDEWQMEVKSEAPADKSKFYIWNAYKRLFHKVKKFV